MLNLLPSILVLGVAALFALRLALTRDSPPERVAERSSAARALTLAVIIQAIHFAEETTTGLNERLGPLFGLPRMPLSIFVIFNIAWLVIWVASIPGLRSSWTPAFFAAWFLAIAGTVNGVVHPLLALAENGYFPGLATSPFIGAASIWLWAQLRRATRERGMELVT